VDIERAVGLDDHVAGDDDLGETSGAHRIASSLDRGQIDVDGDPGHDGEPAGAGRRRGWRLQVGLGAVDGGDPAVTVRSFADRHGRDDELGPVRGTEREHAQGDGPTPGPADRVVALDAGQHARHLGHGHPRRHAPARHADTVADEQEAVAAREAVEVDLAVEWSGDGPHPHRLTSSLR
jgi:hypothetical protein